MAQQSDEFDDRNDSRDDRPRRRDDEPPPKKKGGVAPILLIIGGIVLLGCCGTCGVGGYWFYQQIKAVTDAAEGYVAKLGSGDIAGAYNSMSSSYKAKVTLEQFTEAIKKAKLDQSQKVDWTSNSSNTTNGTGTGALTGTVTLKDGTTTQITLALGFDGKAWTIEDLTLPGSSAPAPKLPNEKTKLKDDKKAPQEDEDK